MGRIVVGASSWASERTGTVRLMFNDDRGGNAPVAAERARELLGQAAAA